MVEWLKRDDAPALAYCFLPPQDAHLPLVMFLTGFRSDMQGTKATYMEKQCQDRGQGYIRFDYSGHGESDGVFEDGTISIWAEDALAIFDHLTQGRKTILVGSSMGGWIAFLLALKRPEQVTGVVGLAAAPDFTLDMISRMSDDQRTLLYAQGYIDVPNDYSDEPYRITKDLIDDGNTNCLIERGIEICMPVRLIQGMKDTDVEWQYAHRIKNAISHDDVEVLLMEDGDHRLSRPQDLEMLDKTIKSLSGA